MPPFSNQRVFMISGGRSSAMMVLKSNPTPDDILLFTDTQREHPKTYKFLDDFEKYEHLKIHRVSYPGGFAGMVAKRSYLPNIMKRICTIELKIRTAKRYLKSLGYLSFINHIGFRADERDRVLGYNNEYKRVIPKFPLYEMGVNKAMVNDFWSKKPYDLEIPSILGNCDLCFLKGKAAIIQIMRHHPEYAQKWIADEKLKGKTYFKDVSYEQLLHAAQSQMSLFDLDLITPAYNCSCTS